MNQNYYLKYILKGHNDEIEDFVKGVLTRNFVEFYNSENVKRAFNNYLTKLDKSLNLDDYLDIRKYTGYGYKWINSVLRGYWDYELLGSKSEEVEQEIRRYASKLSELIASQSNVGTDLKVFRGTSLRAFSKLGIHTLEELINLKGQYLLEEGFTSTSLIRNNSFYDRELDYHEKCNIEIEYLISKETNEAIPLLTSDLSYSENQNELLINSYSLFKVLDVHVDIEANSALLKVVLIPKKIYDPYYQNKESELSGISK